LSYKKTLGIHWRCAVLFKALSFDTSVKVQVFHQKITLLQVKRIASAKYSVTSKSTENCTWVL
jgi:hypothetical protein